MGQHGEDRPFRRAQGSPSGSSGRRVLMESVALPVLDDDYASLLGPMGRQGPDDSERLIEAFPAVGDQCQLMANLGARMLDWNIPSASAPARPIDSRTVPAGYTYLGQFVAHDLSFAAERFPRFGGVATAQSRDNLRDAPLCLETIYGGGPKHFPLAYRCPFGGDRRQADRTHLRLGKTQGSGGKRAPDLPRLSCPELSDLDGVPAAKARGATDVLIPDGRNDDHALISQLTTLFLRSHNRIADTILARSAAGLSEFKTHQVFERARSANVHIYRTIIWNDYLRRILDSEVFARYAPRDGTVGNTMTFVTSADVMRMSVEFSHAAFRFGHAMVKPAYRLGIPKPFELEQILLRSSAVRPDMMPFDEAWLMDWWRFFGGKPDDSVSQFMFSRPLGPTITPMGPDATFIVSDDAGVDRVLPVTVIKSGRTIAARGIATRDLARAYSVPMASVDDIVSVMRRGGDLRAVVDRHPLLADKTFRADAVRRWLEAPGIGDTAKDVAFSTAEAAFLTEHPPLFFFVLFEAEQIGGGVRLGPVGSFIVAETLFARLVAGPAVARVEAGRGYASQALVSPPAAIDADIRGAFGGGIPSTMQELIQHLDS